LRKASAKAALAERIDLGAGKGVQSRVDDACRPQCARPSLGARR
jgi:hypothetical protein